MAIISSDFLHGPEIQDVNTGANPIRSVESAVIGIIGSAGKGPINTPTVVTNRTDAITKFGAFGLDGFSLPKHLDAIFDQIGATCVIINVCDPDVHSDSISDESATFNASKKATLAKPYVSSVSAGSTVVVNKAFSAEANGTLSLPSGISGVSSVKSSDGVTTYVLDTDYSVSGSTVTNLDAAIAEGATVKVTYTASLAEDTDFTVDSDTGVITLTTGSKIANLATATFDYDYVDPTAVAESDIIGADGATRTGVYAFLDAESTVAKKPRVICAPEFTSTETNGAANAVVSELIGENGIDILDQLQAICIADAPASDKDAAIAYTEKFDNKRVYVVFPEVKYTDPSGAVSTRPCSSLVAGLIAQIDADNTPGGYSLSPSNKKVKGILGTSIPIDSSLGSKTSTANTLNNNRVNTVIRRGANFYLWGNRTTTTEEKFTFLSVVRIYDIVTESIKEAQAWAIDQNITGDFVTNVITRVNKFLRKLVSDQVLVDGTVFADGALNTPDSISQGHLYVNIDLVSPTPAERITFLSHISTNYSLDDITG